MIDWLSQWSEHIASLAFLPTTALKNPLVST